MSDFDPNLDTERFTLNTSALDDAAGAAVAGLRIDLAAVQQASVVHLRDQRRQRWTAVAAAVAAVVAIMLVLLPGLGTGRRSIAPATKPPVPPRSLALPPKWTPTAEQAPIARAIYLVQERGQNGQEKAASGQWNPFLVDADTGEFRKLPVAEQTGMAVSVATLSSDGRWAAWVEFTSTLNTMELATGVVHRQPLVGSMGRGVNVSSLAFSPDGTVVAVRGNDSTAASPSLQPSLYLYASAGTSAPQRCELTGQTSSTTQDISIGWGNAGQVIAPSTTQKACGETPLQAAASLLQISGPASPAGRPNVPLVFSADGKARVGLALAGAPSGQVSLYRSATDVTTVVSATDKRTFYAFDKTTSPAAGLLLGTGRGGTLVGHATETGWVTSRVTDDGQVENLTASGDMAVISAATSLVTNAVPGDVKAASDSMLDPRHLQWRVTSAWQQGWLRPVLVLALLIVALRLAFAGGRTLGRGFLTSTRSRARNMLVVLSALLLLEALIGFAVPAMSTASQVRRNAAISTDAIPVLPASTGEQQQKPPPAFSSAGRPGARRVSVIFAGLVGGTYSVYGIEAGRGTLVDLNKLDGGFSDVTGGIGAPHLPGALSPNGRFIAYGTRVLDLQTATWRDVKLPDSLQVIVDGKPDGALQLTMHVVLDDGSLVVLTDSRQLSVYPVNASSFAIKLSSSTPAAQVQVQGDGTVVVAGYDNGQRKAVFQLVSVTERKVTDVITDAGIARPVAITGTGSARAVTTTDDTGALQQNVAGAAPRRLQTPGAIDWLAGASNGTIVASGFGGADAKHAILRKSQDSDSFTVMTHLEPVNAGNEMLLATSLVAASQPAPVVTQPWWQLPHSWSAWAVRLMILNALVLIGVAISLRRRKSLG